MKQKFFSAAYLFTSLFIILGAAGHSFSGVVKVHTALKAVNIDAAVFELIIAVWHFAGVCMLLLGLLAVFAWGRIKRGEKSLMIIPVTIGMFYLLYGIAASVYTRAVFFTIFILLGAMLLVSSMFIRRD